MENEFDKIIREAEFKPQNNVFPMVKEVFETTDTKELSWRLKSNWVCIASFPFGINQTKFILGRVQ
jgi:hypothetical protein